ncbi:MAG: UbiA-like polyprenyltransferase, partial [Armatimonadota bacterium]
FALPFAMVGMMWGSQASTGVAWPGWRVFLLVIVAMVSCRSAAMAFNRIADRDIDAQNPRTAVRALPAVLLSLRQENLFFYASILIFEISAALLNPLALMLSPVALLVTLGYSYTKRFTWLCHFVLGLSLGIAPAAAWIAATGKLSVAILPVVAGVACWTAGFDLIYAMQDDDFDRDHGLQAMPARFGRKATLSTSRILHAGAILMLGWALFLVHAGVFGWIGLVFASAMLAYEQSIVRPHDISRVNLAFFTLNGFVSMGFFVAVLIDVLVQR